MSSVRAGFAPTIGEWIDRCSSRLMQLDPESPLDGTDWDDIADSLWHDHGECVPEAAAERWHGRAPR
jgi:hypothetical protein